MIKKWIFLTSLLLCYCIESRLLKGAKIRPDYQPDTTVMDSLLKYEKFDALRAECNRRLMNKCIDTNSLSFLCCNVGQSYFNKNVDSAIFYLQKAAFYAERAQSVDYIIKTDVYLLILYNRYVSDSTNTSLQLFHKLDSLRGKDLGLKSKMLLFTGLACYYKLAGREHLYLSALFKTASYSETFAATGQATTLDSNNLGVTYQNIGRYYLETGQTPKAMEYYQLSRIWTKDCKRGLANYYRGMMNLFLIRNEQAKALSCADSMHALLHKNNGDVADVVMRADVDLAYHYLAGKNIKAARKCYEFSNRLLIQNPNEVIKGRLKLLAALLLTKEKKYKAALPYLAAIKNEVRRWEPAEYAPYFKIAAECYTGLENYKKANDNYRTCLQLSDSMNNKSLRQSLAFAEVEFQNERKQAEINNQKFVIELAKRQRLWLISALTTLVILTIMIFVFYRAKGRYAQILNLRNVELLKLNVKLDEANKTKATLFGIFSHDLRAPISDVYQLLEIWHLELLGNEEKEMLEEEIRSGTASLLEIMEDMLIWSKTQLEAIHTEIQDVEIGKIFKQCQDLMQLNIYSKEIKVINLITPKSIIKTDPNFVHIIIRNLLQNGIKASPYKGVIEVGFCITKNRKSCFWITNSGSQFSQENYLETLQRKNTSQNLHQGLGLKLVEELSRRIGVEVQFDVIDKNKTCCSLFF